MKYCKRCGMRVDDMTSLCTKCGGMDFMSEEEKARMSNGQAAPNRRPAQNPGMGANRPVRPNGTQPARPQGQPMQGGQQRPMQGGQQRPVQGQGQPMQGGQRPNLQKPVNNGQAAGQGIGGYNPNGGQQRPVQGQNQGGYDTQPQGGYDTQPQGMEEQDMLGDDMPMTVEEAKKKKKKEKAPKQPRTVADAATVTVKDWLILWFKLIIPILNIVVIIQVLTDKNGKYNESVRNYIKAYLIMFAISLVAGLAGSFAVTALIGSML